MVCELCRPLHRETPGRSEIVGRPSTSAPCGRVRAPPDRAPRRLSFAPPWIPCTSASRSTARARRSSPTSPTSRTTPSSATTTSTNWHLTRVDSVGRGAGARFRVGAPLQRFDWGDMTLVVVEPPYRIVAVGRYGKFNRIKTTAIWTLDAGRRRRHRRRVHVRDRARAARPTSVVEALSGQRRWFKRKVRKALSRLQAILEEDHDRGARVTVAGPLESAPDAPPASLVLVLLARARRRRLRPTTTDGATRPRWPTPRASTSTSTTSSTRSQMSRYLNPNDVEDAEYLEGLPAGHGAARRRRDVVRRLGARPERDRRAAPGGRQLGDPRHAGERVPADPDRHGHQPVRVPAGRSTCRPTTVLPLLDTAAGQGPIQGSLLLFKITNDSLQNRPLELRFSNGQQGGQTGVYDLDV